MNNKINAKLNNINVNKILSDIDDEDDLEEY